MIWTYANKPFGPDDIPPKALGFVYEIENITTGKKYVGKKLFYHSQKVYRKGKRPKRKVVESNWQEYYSSCRSLLDDVKTQGKENFQRQILKFCYSKGDLSYEELREQMIRNVLKSSDYYNDYVGARVNRKHLPQP